MAHNDDHIYALMERIREKKSRSVLLPHDEESIKEWEAALDAHSIRYSFDVLSSMIVFESVEDKTTALLLK
ncbi:hypothetical protein M527_14045 [Sphingobium indicum IP26]|nr:hypothetical protein M527_14045 [Sphingobium indicum IP26]